MNARRNQSGCGILLGAVVAFSAVASSLAGNGDCTVSESDQNTQISNQSRQLLRERKFAELESIAEDFRSNKVRLPSGLWKLSIFYDGLERPGYSASGQDWVVHFVLLNEWRAAFPKSATVRTALASAYTTYAWEARGSGFAKTVTDEGWQLFRKRLGQAEEIIAEAEAESLYDPHLAAVHLMVGKGASWPEQRHERVFNEAARREPCYPLYYFQRANWLLPRWNGRPGDCERFADQAIALNESCEGKGIYARIAVYLNRYQDRDEWFFDVYKLSWPTVHEGFAELERRYPDSLWNLNSHCSLACSARDWTAATELFQRIGDRWDGSVWGNEGEYQRWKNWAANPVERPVYPQGVAGYVARWRQALRGMVATLWIGAIGFVSYRFWKRRRAAIPPPLPPVMPS